MREGQKVSLRSLRQDDMAVLYKWINDPDVIKYTNTFKPVSEMEQKIWFQSLPEHKDQIVLGIELRNDKKLIGTCGLYFIDYQNRAAEVRIKIGAKSYWGRGYGKEAIELLIDFAFVDLNLRRLSLKVLSNNNRALKIYKKTGFQEEGILKEAMYIQGKYCDLIAMGMLRKNT